MTERERNRAMPAPKPAAGTPASAGETAASPEKQFDPSKFGATTIPHELRLELLQMKRPAAPRSRLYGYGIVPPGAEQLDPDAEEALDALLADETTKPVASAEEQRAAEGHVNTLTGLPAPPPNPQPELAYTSPSVFNEHRTMLGLSTSPASAPADAEPQSSAPTQPSRAAARARRHRRLATLGLLVLCGSGISAGLLFHGTPPQARQRTVSAARSSANSVPRIVNVPAVARATSSASSPTSVAGDATTASPRAPTHVNHAKKRAPNSAAAAPPVAASSPSPNNETESKSWINVRD